MRSSRRSASISVISGSAASTAGEVHLRAAQRKMDVRSRAHARARLEVAARARVPDRSRASASCTRVHLCKRGSDEGGVSSTRSRSSKEVRRRRTSHLSDLSTSLRKIGDKSAHKPAKCQRYWLVMRDHYYPTISNTPNDHYYAPYCYSNALL